MTKLGTARDVAKALGGIRALADLTGAKYDNAHTWIRRGWFARQTYLAITTELDKRGLVASPDLWRMTAPR